MNCERTWERYDEDEYFIYFFRINPRLTYVTEKDKLLYAKYQLQQKLLDEVDNKIISQDEAIQKYKTVFDKVQANNQKLAEIIHFHKVYYEEQIKIAKEKLENNTIQSINNLM